MVLRGDGFNAYSAEFDDVATRSCGRKCQWYTDALLDFTAIRFIETEFESGYYKYPFFDYKTAHVWKGQPDERGTAFLSYSDSIHIYDQPVMFESDQKYVDELASKPRKLRIYYAEETEHGLTYGGCEDILSFDHAFTYRLQLGHPLISYHDQVFSQLTAKDIFDFFDSMDRVFKDEREMYEYHVYVKDGVQALLQLDQQEAMLNYLLTGPFTDCPNTPSVNIVVSALIAALPESADELFNRFFSLLDCGTPDTRPELYKAFAKHASTSDMYALVDHLLQDPSDMVLSSVAGSLDNHETEAYRSLIGQSILMLDSNNADERMFAAELLHDARNDYFTKFEVVSRICAAKYAEWKFPQYDYVSSISDICQQEIKSFKSRSDLTLAEQRLFDRYYIDPEY